MQVWFYQGSAAEDLLRPLAERYALRALAPQAAPNGHPTADGAAVVCVADLEQDDYLRLAESAGGGADVRLVALVGSDGRQNGAGVAEVFAYLPRQAPRPLLERTLEAAFDNIELARRERALREELARTEREMEELNQIGVALSSEMDIGKLFHLILEKSRQITSADAGSLYLLEQVNDRPHLRFKLTQNDSLEFPFQEFTLPITEQSMAGYVALRGEALNLPDAYQIPPEMPVKFNPAFDQKTGYRTRSVLTLPMKSPRGELLGVLQLINCKRRFAARLTSAGVVEREVVPFSDRAVRLALSLASQAAVAYEKNRLYEDIERLFEGFVEASVLAIEQRDPTTSGHSFRVATLTLGMAEAVNRTETGTLAAIRFTAEQIKEIRYAALLHDFGKVAVREEVLVKAKKLYPLQLELVRQRFDFLRKEFESQALRRQLERALREGPEARKACEELERELGEQLAELEEAFHYVAQVNEPTVLPEGDFRRLAEIARVRYLDPRGAEHPLLAPDEVRFLSIRKGTLDPDERRQIESHVVHTFNFLMRIPWTREIKQIPTIALSHHELYNGAGYPYRLSGEQIPIQTRMMTVCDIYDALSAADRPYKRAVSTERAVQILEMATKDGELDPVLFQLFVEAKVFELTGVRA